MDFFDASYLRVFEPELTAERTAEEVEAVVELLGLPPGARLLDLCCGHGRHAVALAARGYRVTGLDRSALFLERGRTAAAAAGVDVGWVHGDMRALPFTGRFDAVVNLFNAFGYLESDAEDQRVLDAVRRVLVPGGLLLQEIANRDALLRGWTPASVHRFDDGLVLVEERHFDLRRSRTQTTYTFLEAGTAPRTVHHVIRAYTLPELERMYQAAGLHLELVLGGLDGGELDLDDPLVVLRGRVDGGEG